MKKDITINKTYEIEVKELSREIPKEQEIDFIEWLTMNTWELGKNCEYYAYTDNYKDDIEVIFYVNQIK